MAEGRTAFDLEPDGFYVEPPWCTKFLLERESFADMVVWDPACGQGNIVRTLVSAGVHAFGTDLRDRTEGPPAERTWFSRQLDFLDEQHRPYPAWDAIITNPPYGHAKTAEAFIRRALAMEPTKKLAVFVNSKFIFSKTRAAELFTEHAPSRIWPVTPRPSCPPGQYLQAGNRASGGVADFCWLVWSRFDQEPSYAKRPASAFGW